MSFILNIIDKYRKEAYRDYICNHNNEVTWRRAILESIFKPEFPKIPGKGPMDMLHPDIKKLHLPENVYIADWRKYKVEDHPMLMDFQKRLHTVGLHDPWLRNHAYKFYHNRSGPRSVTRFTTEGIVFGFILGATIFGLEKLYDHYYPSQPLTAAEYDNRFKKVE